HMEVPKSAAYALAAIGAKEHAGDIAKLLKDEFRQGDAAKALAIVGATEYVSEIAKLLVAKSGLTRSAALISLAFLDSKKHIPQMINLYNGDPENYVKLHAALALLLMEFPKYYRAINAGTDQKDSPTLLDIDFHYFVINKLAPFNEKLKINLKSQKSTSN
ncbi:MAG: HEAT repeat domain-containing protein, partial [Pyrinomonadaceae bacterium]